MQAITDKNQRRVDTSRTRAAARLIRICSPTFSGVGAPSSAPAGMTGVLIHHLLFQRTWLQYP